MKESIMEKRMLRIINSIRNWLQYTCTHKYIHTETLLENFSLKSMTYFQRQTFLFIIIFISLLAYELIAALILGLD